jgi:general secretion pathway protein B
MSLILDALKKLEQEKAARKDGALNVAAEILQPERPRPRNKKRTVLFTVAAVGAVLAAIAVLALRGGTGVLKQSSPSAPAAPSTVSRAAMPAPLPLAATAQKSEELPVARPRADIGKGELLPPPAVSHPRPAAAAAHKEIDAPEYSSHGSVSHLRVSGIVWQEERSARRAFVNGIIAVEGSVIDGAKLVEIYPARIRFSRGGESFDISIEKIP